MKKIALTVALLISLVLLAGCSSSAEQPLPQASEANKAAPMRLLSSASPVKVLPAFTSFTWNDQYNAVLSAVDGQQRDAVKGDIRRELITYLKSKGYQYQPDPAQADLVFGFLYTLDDAPADKTTLAKFGLLPGMQRNSRNELRYAKGTFMLAVLNSELTKVYWRSALQGFVELEKDKQAVNSQRMQTVLGMMLGGFPKAGR